MWIKYHKHELEPYEYIEFEEANYSDYGNSEKILRLYKNKEEFLQIDLKKITFFYISEEDPRI